MTVKWIDLGNGHRILVEVDKSGDDIPTYEIDGQGNRLVTGKPNNYVEHTLLEQLNSLASVINTAADQVRPDEIELTGQVKFSGETGIPIFVRASGETSFQIKLVWKRSTKQRDELC